MNLLVDMNNDFSNRNQDLDYYLRYATIKNGMSTTEFAWRLNLLVFKFYSHLKDNIVIKLMVFKYNMSAFPALIQKNSRKYQILYISPKLGVRLVNNYKTVRLKKNFTSSVVELADEFEIRSNNQSSITLKLITNFSELSSLENVALKIQLKNIQQTP